MFAKMVGRRATALATSLAVVIGLAITPAFTATAAEGDEPVITPQTTEVVPEETPPADPPAPVEEAPAAPAAPTPPAGPTASVERTTVGEPVEVPSEELPADEVPASPAEPVEAPGTQRMTLSAPEQPSAMSTQSAGITPATLPSQFLLGQPLDVQFGGVDADRWDMRLDFLSNANLSPSGYLTGYFSRPGNHTLTVRAQEKRFGLFGISYYVTVASEQYDFKVVPGVLTESLPSATVGEPYSQRLEGTLIGGIVRSNTFSLANGSTLPDGLSLSSSGLISGTPADVQANPELHSFDVKLHVWNVISGAHESAAKTLSITVGYPAPTWDPIVLPTATVGVPYTATSVRADGNGWTVSSYTAAGLPAGLEISLSGLITGTATGDVSYAPIQTVPVTITADNGKTASTEEYMIVKSPPSVTTTALPDAWLTKHYSAAITTAGPSAELTATDLPAGLSLIGNVVDGYSIDGTPTVAGDFTIKLTATNDAGSSVFPVTVTVNAAPVFSTHGTLPTAFTGTEYITDIDAIGKNITYSLVKAPAGMVIDPATGVLSGWTPPDEVNVQARVLATNPSGSLLKIFTIRPFAVPMITDAPLNHGVVGEAYSDEIEFTGRVVRIAKTTGTLPPGLTLERDGELHGTPTAAGDFTFEVQANNLAGTVVQSFTVSVTVPAMQLSTGSVLRGGSLTVTGSGYVPGDKLELWLHSTPMLLGTVTSVDGTFTKSVTIPANVPAGAHNLVVTGTQSGTQSMPLTVTAPAVVPQRPQATTPSQSPSLTVTPSVESTTVDDTDEADDSEVEENEADEELPTLPEPQADEESTPATPVNWTGLLVAGFALLLAALALWFILWRRRRATES